MNAPLLLSTSAENPVRAPVVAAVDEAVQLVESSVAGAQTAAEVLAEIGHRTCAARGGRR